MRLTDAVFGRLIVDIREIFAAIPSELKSDLDGEFLTAIAEQPNDILKCAMYLFLGYLDGATQYVSFASRSLANVGRRPVRGRRSRKLPTAIRPIVRRRWHLIRPPVGSQSGWRWSPLRLPLHDASSQDVKTDSAKTRSGRKTMKKRSFFLSCE